MILPSGTTLVPAMTTGLSQTLRRADSALARSGLEMKHLQGAFGESLVDGYLSQAAEWSSLRQTIGRQGIDLLHVKVLPDGRIDDTIISEVKTGGSRLGQTQTGTQMSGTWKASRLLKISARYQRLKLTWEKSPAVVKPIPKGLSAKQVLDIPLGGGRCAVAWRENSLAAWKIDTDGAGRDRIKTQLGRLSQHLNAVANDVEGHRSRLIHLGFDAKNMQVTIKDAAGLATGGKVSQLPVLRQFEMSWSSAKTVGPLQKALEAELRRSQPLMTDFEVKSQARELALRNLRQLLADTSRNPWMIASQHAVVTGVWAGVATVVLDAAFQYADSGSVEWSRTRDFALAGSGSAFAGGLAGAGTTYGLLHTQSGLELTRTVAASMGLRSTSYAANLIGSASGAGLATVGMPYLLYCMGYIDITTASRMAVNGGFGVLAGAGAAWAATSLIATYGVAGTGTAIASLSGAAASSATLAWIGGGSVALGSALSATGIGLIAVGAGFVVNCAFEVWDQKNESERLRYMAEHLSRHWQKETNTKLLSP